MTSYSEGMATKNIFASLAVLWSGFAAAQSYPTPRFSNIIVPSLPGLSLNVQGTGIPGLDGANWMIFQNQMAVPTQQSTFRVQRNASYTGGTVGNVYNGIWGNCSSQAGVTAFEWCGLFSMDNYSTAGENTGLYGQAFKRPGAGPTFAAVNEVRDYNANSTTGAVGTEIDLWGTDGDANGVRVILDVVGGPIPGVTGHNPTITRALRIGATFGVAANATFNRGLSFGSATWAGSFIGTENTPTSIGGIDLSAATFSSFAIKTPNFLVDNYGNVALSGGIPVLALNASSGANTRTINGQTNGVNRWQVQPGNSAAESGANSGSDFEIGRFNDGGGAQPNSFKISRSSGAITMPGPAILLSYTVAGLPVCAAALKGAMAYVTDSTAPTYNAALVGGGTVGVPVACNGAAWSSH